MQASMVLWSHGSAVETKDLHVRAVMTGWWIKLYQNGPVILFNCGLFPGASFDAFPDLSKRRGQTDAKLTRLYEEEIRKLWSKVYATSEDKIAEWLKDPLIDYEPCANTPQGEIKVVDRLREDFHKSIALEDVACFIIMAPLKNRFRTKEVVGKEYDIPINENQTLPWELEDLKKRTLLEEIEIEGLLHCVFANKFKEVQSSLEDFMKEKATKAKEVLIIFMGHGEDDGGQGTMCFQDENAPVPNVALFEAVKMYRDKNSLLGSAFSVVLTQCFSHLGIDTLPQEQGITVTPLASTTCPCPEVTIKYE